MYVYKIRPFPAVRVNGKGGRFTLRATKYHSQMEELRWLLYKEKEQIISALLSWNYHLEFIFSPAKSLSKKKRKDIIGKPHKGKPDIDNLFKAFTDTVFYWEKENDSGIYKINCSKKRGEENKIIFS